MVVLFPRQWLYITFKEVIYMKKFIVRKRGNYVQRTCRIEEEVLEKIEQLVVDYNLQSTNSFINDALRFAIENMEIEK